jgi:hypothetical protein
MDEVDVNLNPKVGCMWMLRGQQAAVETPGANEKRDLAGSIHRRTGRVILTEGKPREGRSAVLFCRHLDDPRQRFLGEAQLTGQLQHPGAPPSLTWASWPTAGRTSR